MALYIPQTKVFAMPLNTFKIIVHCQRTICKKRVLIVNLIYFFIYRVTNWTLKIKLKYLPKILKTNSDHSYDLDLSNRTKKVANDILWDCTFKKWNRRLIHANRMLSRAVFNLPFIGFQLIDKQTVTQDLQHLFFIYAPLRPETLWNEIPWNGRHSMDFLQHFFFSLLWLCIMSIKFVVTLHYCVYRRVG